MNRPKKEFRRLPSSSHEAKDRLYNHIAKTVSSLDVSTRVAANYRSSAMASAENTLDHDAGVAVLPGMSAFTVFGAVLV
jgi:hypothetical protein